MKKKKKSGAEATGHFLFTRNFLRVAERWPSSCDFGLQDFLGMLKLRKTGVPCWSVGSHCIGARTWLMAWSPGRSSAIWLARWGRPPRSAGLSFCPSPLSSRTRASSRMLQGERERKKSLVYFTTSLFISPVLSCVTQLTLAVLGLNNLHLLQTFEHAPQVGDAVLKGNFLVLTRMGAFKQLPHINLWFLFLPLLPGRSNCCG